MSNLKFVVHCGNLNHTNTKEMHVQQIPWNNVEKITCDIKILLVNPFSFLSVAVVTDDSHQFSLPPCSHTNWAYSLHDLIGSTCPCMILQTCQWCMIQPTCPTQPALNDWLNRWAVCIVWQTLAAGNWSRQHSCTQWLGQKHGSEIHVTFTSRFCSLQALTCLNQWKWCRKKVWMQDVEKWALWFFTIGTVITLRYLSAVTGFLAHDLLFSWLTRFSGHIQAIQFWFVRLR